MSIVDDIEKVLDKGSGLKGIVLILVLEVVLYIKYFGIIKAWNFYNLQWWILPAIVIITLFIWSLITVRLYIREGWVLLVWVLAASVLSIANYFLLPVLLPQITQNILLVASIGLFVLTIFLILVLLTRKISREKYYLFFS